MSSGIIQDQINHGTQNSVDLHPGIFETANHQLRVHGGNLSARLMLAKEYYRLNPNSVMYIEHFSTEVANKYPFIKFPPDNAGDVFRMVEVPGKVTDITSANTKVF